jgi:RNA polymerase sigma-70 factor (ECF subfamily)
MDEHAQDLATTAPGLPAQLRECQCWLRTVAMARLRDVHAVDEVLQNVALAVLAAEGNVVVVQHAEPWLYRVTLRQCLLYRRKLGRQRRAYERLRFQRHETADEQARTDPLLWLLADERRVLIRKALEQLDPRDAQVLQMKYVEDKSYFQIASRLGVSTSTVESRLHRARQRLRHHLAARHIQEVLG